MNLAYVKPALIHNMYAVKYAVISIGEGHRSSAKGARIEAPRGTPESGGVWGEVSPSPLGMGSEDGAPQKIFGIFISNW